MVCFVPLWVIGTTLLLVSIFQLITGNNPSELPPFVWLTLVALAVLGGGAIYVGREWWSTSSPDEAGSARLECDPVEPYRDEIFQRLFRGEEMEQVAQDIARRTGIRADEVSATYRQRWMWKK
jgi:hypothetical protein